MSQVKFEKETVRSTGGGKEDFMHNVGEALTKGGSPNGYLAVCVSSESRITRHFVLSHAQR